MAHTELDLRERNAVQQTREARQPISVIAAEIDGGTNSPRLNALTEKAEVAATPENVRPARPVCGQAAAVAASSTAWHSASSAQRVGGSAEHTCLRPGPTS